MVETPPSALEQSDWSGWTLDTSTSNSLWRAKREGHADQVVGYLLLNRVVVFRGPEGPEDDEGERRFCATVDKARRFVERVFREHGGVVEEDKQP